MSANVRAYYMLMGGKATAPPPDVDYVGIYNSLVAYWPFDGSLADAVTGNALSGSATYEGTSTGQRANNSTVLTQNRVMSTLSSASFSVGGRWTPSVIGTPQTFWCYRTAATGSYEVVYFSVSGAGQLKAGFHDGTAYREVASSAECVAGTTFDSLLTYDGVNVILYKDGDEVGRLALSATPRAGARVDFGFAYANDTSYDHDEVFVCNIPLPPAAVKAIHNDGAGLSYYELEYLATGALPVYGDLYYAAGTSFSATLTTSIASDGVNTWTVVAGALPSEWSLNPSTGVVSGPAATGTHTVTIQVEDSRGRIGQREFVISEGAFTRWRVYVTEADASTGTSLAEVEFRASVGGATLCTGGTAFASTEYPGWVAANAFNGLSSDPGWSSNGAVPQHVGYVLAAPARVVEVAIRARQSNTFGQSPKTFNIQRSSDGSAWTTEWSVTDSSGWAPSELRTFVRP